MWLRGRRERERKVGRKEGKREQGRREERRRGGGSKVCNSLGMLGVASYSLIYEMVPLSSRYVTDFYIDLTTATKKRISVILSFPDPGHSLPTSATHIS